MNQYQSKAGYTGAIAFVLLAFINYFYYFNIAKLLDFKLTMEERLICMVLIVFILMLIHEVWAKNRYYHKNIVVDITTIHKNHRQIFISSLWRFFALSLIFYLPYSLVTYHYYFQSSAFNTTRLFYGYLLYAYLILGLPYIFLTLKYKGGHKYEFNDYGILSLLSFKGLYYLFLSLIKPSDKLKHKAKSLITNKRVIKIYLVFFVNFFFLTLMTKFLATEYLQFQQALGTLMHDNYSTHQFFGRYRTVYLMLYHLIFIVDVGLAIIGYTIATRWLDNRTKSVDMTLYGWLVALLCYPPMNSGFTDQFIGYGRISTETLVHSETILMILMFLILCCFTIYVWATAALGFKFSNLTNRGVVFHGPYKLFRHPAYTSKNLAWWLDNTYVLTNFWAALALAIWNIIYVLRGLTEETHLSKDPEYKVYMTQTPDRFIPIKGVKNFYKSIMRLFIFNKSKK